MTRPLTRDELVRTLEGQIVSGELRAGDKLPSERQLAERYQISRPLVREILRSLAGSKLVEIEPGRGAFVRLQQPSDAADSLDLLVRLTGVTPRQLTEARLALEAEACWLATARATETDLGVIRRMLESYETASDVIDRTRFDASFHVALVAAAHNPVIELMYDAISGLVREMVFRSNADTEMTHARSQLPDHRDVYEAVASRDAARARDTMIAHLSLDEALYGPDFDRRLHAQAGRQLRELLHARQSANSRA